MKEQSARSRDPRPARTRQALLDATQTLLMDRSLDGLTIDEIANAAGVGRGSFYNHFADKEALGAVIVARIRDHISGLIVQVNQDIDDPAERVMRALFASIQYAVDFPEAARVIVNLGLTTTDPNSPINARLVRDLQRGLAKGSFSFKGIDVGVGIVVGLTTIAMRHVLEGWIDDNRYPSELAARMAIALGVSPDYAIELSRELVKQTDTAIGPAKRRARSNA